MLERSGWIRSLMFFVVSKVYEKIKKSNLVSHGRKTKDKVRMIIIFLVCVMKTDI